MSKENKEITEENKDELMTTDPILNVEGSYKPHIFRPAIICGICEACGSVKNEGGTVTKVHDKASGQDGLRVKGGQWVEINATKCPHYRSLFDQGKAIKCSGCNEIFTGAKNSMNKFSEKLGYRTLYAISFIDQDTGKASNSVVFYCDDWSCSKKRFARISNS